MQALANIIQTTYLTIVSVHGYQLIVEQSRQLGTKTAPMCFILLEQCIFKSIHQETGQILNCEEQLLRQGTWHWWNTRFLCGTVEAETTINAQAPWSQVGQDLKHILANLIPLQRIKYRFDNVALSSKHLCFPELVAMSLRSCGRTASSSPTYLINSCILKHNIFCSQVGFQTSPLLKAGTHKPPCV